MSTDDDVTPVMVMDPRIEVEQLRAQLETMRSEQNALKKIAWIANIYETTLKLQLGHIVELLSAGVAWRESKGGSKQTERLQKAIDTVMNKEASRRGP